MNHLPDTPGLRLLSSAWGFRRAAELLHQDDPRSLTWAPCFAILGLAIEVALKGFSREHGMSEAKQIALGHDLIKAFDTALSCGFVPSDPRYQMLVAAITPGYKDMSFRYQIGTSVVLPRLEDIMQVVQAFIYELYEQGTQKYRLSTTAPSGP